MSNKISIKMTSDTHTTEYKFFLEDEEITDVYLSTKTDTTGMADFIPMHCVPYVVKKAIDVLLEEGN